MLSISPLTVDSFPIALIKKGSKVKETIYFTEPTRGSKIKTTPFRDQVEGYLAEQSAAPIEGAHVLTDEYSFEMLPTISQVTIPKSSISIFEEPQEPPVRYYGNPPKKILHEDKKSIFVPGEKTPRFINYYLSSSNSGKSYQIAALCRRYLEMWPNNLIAYASANPIANDKNYDDIRDKIREVDVLNLESTIDFTNPDYHNSLWIFDDCDSGFSVSMEDLDSRLTKEELSKLTVTDKQKAVKMLKAKCEAASEWVSRSVQSFMMNGRKFSQSLCVVSHKPFEGRYENKIVNEATGVVLFPASIKKNILKRFLVEKLSFEKDEAKAVIDDLDWYQYDFLYVSHRTSRPFVLTNTL
jgi:hypothetical protein